MKRVALPIAAWPSAGRVWTGVLGLVLVATGTAVALAQSGPVQYRDVVFSRVVRTADIVYGRAVDIPSQQPLDLRLDLYEAEGDTAPARPVLLFVHGGGFVGGEKSAGRRWAEEFARRGWVAMSIGYRLNQGDLASVGIPAAVEDARQAMRWVSREADTYRLDTSRVVVGGSSAGGITALFLAYTDVSRTPADATSTVAGVMDLWGALYGQEDQMAPGDPPLVIVHGTEDTVVPYHHAEALRDRAAAVGIPHAFHPLPGVGHGSLETAQISAWAAEFFHPLLWPSGATPAVTPTSGTPGTAAPFPSRTPATASETPSPPPVTPSVLPPSVTASPRPAPTSWPPTGVPTSPAVYLPLALGMANPRLPPAPATPGVQATVTPVPGMVRTGSGLVVGTLDGDVWRFLGIPYAAPPIGNLRWRPPAPPAPWSVPLEAGAFGPACSQYDDNGTAFGNEDCLTLNVWTPRDALVGGPARPVLFFLHGGGHEQGSSSVTAGDRALYDGHTFAEKHGLVVVTINYRLGPFGFLAHPALSAEGGARASGNYGALDQLAALQWVHDAIAAFGGDPGRVTVFGQSAGSVSTCRLVASPLARGLVHRAALMSGACVATPLEAAEAKGVLVADKLGCTGTADVPACLRGKSTAEVMSTLDPMDNGTDSLGRMSYDGVVDGYLLPASPRTLIAAGRHNDMPVLIGTTSAENGMNAPAITTEAQYEAAVRAYVQRSALPATVADRALAAYPAADYPTPRDAYVALTSDVKFVCQARADARLLAGAQAAPVFRYQFDHLPDNGGQQARSRGAFHGLDLPYLFGVLEFGLGAVRYRPGAGDQAVSAAMQSYWARFAATGDPNGGAAVGWPAYVPADDPYVRLAPTVTHEMGLRTAQCDFWDGLTGR